MTQIQKNVTFSQSKDTSIYFQKLVQNKLKFEEDCLKTIGKDRFRIE